MMEITIDEAIQCADIIYIDVRSAAEYREASIPGAINIPLFNEQEHRELGSIYRAAGESEARLRAIEIAAPKLPSLVDEIRSVCGAKTPLLYCYRGGLRSLSLYQILNLAGIPCLRLKKGYKAFRKYVNRRMSLYEIGQHLFVLNGLTGVGKTALIAMLKEKGLPSIDLEDLARHRGSVFGTIGIKENRSQKDFDALLLEQLDHYKSIGCPYLVVEGEGKRIGNIYLPEFLTRAMENGCHILLSASLERRVRRILETYLPAQIQPELKLQLISSVSQLKNRLGARKTGELVAMINEDNYHCAVKILCTDYYDQLYSDSRPDCSSFAYTVDAEHLEIAAGKVIAIIKGEFENRPNPSGTP